MAGALNVVPFFERLGGAEHVLVAGAGGGFDVYAGIPLYVALRSAGKRVSLANLTFTYLGGTTAQMVAPHLYEVTAATRGEDGYFPERRLAEWLATRGDDAPIYTFEKVGVRPMRAAYEALHAHLGFDALVLVDGGTDILMRGDEAGLGTPQEDMTSLASVAQLPVTTKLIASIGFGIDSFHGVCHAHFLENVAALSAAGGYVGAFSMLPTMPEGRAFLEAVAFASARTPKRPSIVNGSIAAAVEGRFGDVQFTHRTADSELFINPLMGLYFTFDLSAVVAHSLYLPMLEGTDTIFDVSLRIEAFRETVSIRPRRPIPH